MTHAGRRHGVARSTPVPERARTSRKDITPCSTLKANLSASDLDRILGRTVQFYALRCCVAEVLHRRPFLANNAGIHQRFPTISDSLGRLQQRTSHAGIKLSSKGSTRLDRLELLHVPDKNGRFVKLREHPGHLSAADHSGLVDHALFLSHCNS